MRACLSSLLLVVLIPVVFVSSLSAAPPPGTGTIAGVVRFTGKVPAVKEILTTEGGFIKHRDLIVDEMSKGLRDVVAVLEDAPAQPPLKDAKPLIVDQRDMIFLPRIVVVQHGRPISFDNSDACNHSVMASSTRAANQLNIFVGQGKPYTHLFEAQKHPIPIGCALHAWMRAWVYVVPHPWFAQSDDKGTFKIVNIPPGRYTLLLRHPDGALLERRPITVEAGKTVEVEVEWNKVGS